MRLLSIETSGRQASLAVLEGLDEGARLLVETRLDGPQRTAQVLAPALRDLLSQVEWPASSIELITVVVGPGSFTGLRIGVTTAKTLAYAVGAAVVGVDTLSVLASQAPPGGNPLWTLVDAQRQELFAAKFKESGTPSPHATVEPQILSVEAWLAALAPGDRVTGPVLKRLAARLPTGVEPVAEKLWQPTAGAVGRVGWEAFRQGRRDDVWTLSPQYYRPSAAEEKAAKAEGGR
jgi:tRNA threonylcarbamoyladenosine biosynthesis protein TsaB